MTNSDDCNDSGSDLDNDGIADGFAFHPDADEYCDGLDNDCDDEIDENAINSTPWFRDVDEDNQGDVTDIVYDCTTPEGYVENSDCDDTDENIYLGAAIKEIELCTKGLGC